MNHAQFWGGGGAASYEIGQSLRFDGAARLSRTPSSAGNLKTGTISFWIKRSKLQFSPVQNTQMSLLGCTGNGPFLLRYRYQQDYLEYNQGKSGGTGGFETLAHYRDVSAWQHVCLVNDFTNATSTDKARLYINGVRQDLTITSTITDADGSWNSANLHYIGYQAAYFHGYMAEFHNVDGTALDPTSFGEYDESGVWRPIAYDGSYGTNGFYLKFDPSATNGIGHDHSGNGNNFTPTGFTTSGTGTDVMSDTPTTNWATLNPIWNEIKATYAEGSLQFTGGNTHSPSVSTISASSGKYYFEATALSGSADKWSLGIIDTAIKYRKSSGNNYIPGFTPSNIYSPGDAISLYNNIIYKNGSSIVSSVFSGGAVAAGDVVQMAVDIDAGKIWFGIDGTWNNGGGTEGAFNPSGHDATFAANDDYIFHFTAESCGWDVNFGQRDFEQTVPTGFKALNTSNLSAPDIADGSENFQAIIGPGPGSGSSSPIAIQWKTSNSGSTNAQNEYYGKPAADANNDSAHPMFQWVKSLTIGGYTDWYIPAKHELEILFRNFKPTTDLNLTDPNHGSTPTAGTNPHAVPPTGPYTSTNPAQTTVTSFQSGNANAFYSPGSASYPMYWDATEKSSNTTTAGIQNFTEGMQRASGGGKSATGTGLARAIRRVAYTGSEPAIGAAYEGGFFAGLIDARPSPNGTATHALIVAPKEGGEYGVATDILSVAQRAVPSGVWWTKDRQNTNQNQILDTISTSSSVLRSPQTGRVSYVSPSGFSVAWAWSAPSSGTSNTDGTITTTTRVNSAAGFSLITYTGTGGASSVGHGLGVAPEMVWSTSLTDTVSTQLMIGSDYLPGWTNFLELNSSAAYSTSSTRWNDTAPTSTVVHVGNACNYSGHTMIMYAWHSIPGYSKFGAYSGYYTNSGMEPFIYTGFKPKWLLIKNGERSSTNWVLLDTSRDTYNAAGFPLKADSAAGESTYSAKLDILSNGFKLRTTELSYNGPDDAPGLLYMAFAEHPFGGSGVSPATAR